MPESRQERVAYPGPANLLRGEQVAAAEDEVVKQQFRSEADIRNTSERR